MSLQVVTDFSQPMKLGTRLRRLAAAQGKKPKEVAHAIGTSVQWVSKLYCGSRRIKPATLDRLIEALGLEYMAVALHMEAAREYGFRVPAPIHRRA